MWSGVEEHARWKNSCRYKAFCIIPSISRKLSQNTAVKMKLVRQLLVASQLLGALAQQWPIHSDGLNEVVQWDHYSLIVNGERLFFWSGEFHYWRIPVPELWQDILEKIKAGMLTPAASAQDGVD